LIFVLFSPHFKGQPPLASMTWSISPMSLIESPNAARVAAMPSPNDSKKR
jgi:hypothetical protein